VLAMSERMRAAERQTIEFLDALFEDDLHARRVWSLADGTIGVLRSASLAVHAVGQGLALAKELKPKHAVKQVDRMLSNRGIDVWALFAKWVPYLMGDRDEAVIALDWTDFDADRQATIAAYLLTTHGRATPLMWKTVCKLDLQDRRNEHEDSLLMRLREVMPEKVRVTIVADRGFADQKLYKLLDELDFDFVIRFRGSIIVGDGKGTSKPANEWVSPTGRPRRLLAAEVTNDRHVVPQVVCVRAPRMKEAWCLAASLGEFTASDVVKLYGKRFTIEESFRDAKDIHFGMGLSSTRISTPERRDRLLLLSALATVLLTLLGAAAESLGMDRWLKVNTSKKRQHSLFRQGSYWYAALPNMRAEWFEPLLKRFNQLLDEQPVFREIFGVI
jgi:hypothetical protein